MREVTGRPEVVEAGAARLVGTSLEAIVAGVRLPLIDSAQYTARQIDHSPHRDGHTAERIVDWMSERGWQS
jgi:UDP-N-acetylglucosamine 2-epimerase